MFVTRANRLVFTNSLGVGPMMTTKSQTSHSVLWKSKGYREVFFNLEFDEKIKNKIFPSIFVRRQHDTDFKNRFELFYFDHLTRAIIRQKATDKYSELISMEN